MFSLDVYEWSDYHVEAWLWINSELTLYCQFINGFTLSFPKGLFKCNILSQRASQCIWSIFIIRSLSYHVFIHWVRFFLFRSLRSLRSLRNLRQKKRFFLFRSFRSLRSFRQNVRQLRVVLNCLIQSRDAMFCIFGFVYFLNFVFCCL